MHTETSNKGMLQITQQHNANTHQPKRQVYKHIEYGNNTDQAVQQARAGTAFQANAAI